jgi:hypothetical protein
MTARYAVHVMAHHHPHLFADLVASLRHPDIDIYAHIDRKVDEGGFRRALDPDANVHFVDRARRVRVRWGAPSVVTATLTLLDTSAATGRRYHRHSLLSGTDLLLRPLPDLLDAWADDTEYIRVDCEVDGGSGGSAPGRHSSTITRYHFADHPVLHRVSGRIRRRPVDPRPFRGSNWWSLTDAAVTAIRTTLARDPGWRRDLRFSLCSDEILFHSILMASPFADAMNQNYAGCVHPDYRVLSDECVHSDQTIHGQHFIDWSDPDGISPPELDADALRRALAGPALFARKVGPEWTWRGGALPTPTTAPVDEIAPTTTRPSQVRQ